ncbi:hypothetical protein DY000_02038762 [Brassica cretica]|uniref:Uncharacterized protein n=1 Tax=Brassica cretica TaxID=69181 RepID=A0ABQ7B6L2_BRACR|nr:hypothetical protein DY000_02038762 [Brassica cretica]
MVLYLSDSTSQRRNLSRAPRQQQQIKGEFSDKLRIQIGENVRVRSNSLDGRDKAQLKISPIKIFTKLRRQPIDRTSGFKSANPEAPSTERSSDEILRRRISRVQKSKIVTDGNREGTRVCAMGICRVQRDLPLIYLIVLLLFVS